MSKDTSESITEDFLEMLKSLTKTALKASATILNYRLEKKWEQFIDEFYESYEPSLYDRTGSTYEASNMYDKNLPELKNNRLAWKWKSINPTKNNSIIAGIEIDYKNIGDNPYKADLEWVFNRTFEEGIHGYTKEEALSHSWSFRNNQDPLNPSPSKRMDIFFKTINKKYCNDLFQQNVIIAYNDYRKGKK